MVLAHLPFKVWEPSELQNHKIGLLQYYYMLLKLLVILSWNSTSWKYIHYALKWYTGTYFKPILTCWLIGIAHMCEIVTESAYELQVTGVVSTYVHEQHGVAKNTPNWYSSLSLALFWQSLYVPFDFAFTCLHYFLHAYMQLLHICICFIKASWMGRCVSRT